MVKLIESAGRLYQETSTPRAEPEEVRPHGWFVIRMHLSQGWHSAEAETDSGLTVTEIAELVAEHEEARITRQALEHAKASADSCWERVDSAARIMRSRSISHDKRLSKAAFELGLVGENAGEGSSRVDHKMIADHYYTLRTRGMWPAAEGDQRLEPHSHDDAVTIVETAHKIGWDSLRRAWRRKGIEVSINAEIFPIK